MRSSIFVPEKINVGFVERQDTYTKKLAYVIYFDQSNKLRKEASWQSWRDKKIDPIIFDNEPMSGFVLNKKVGDYSCNWNHRQAYIRVYDPRDFEFEITVENLLYILENTSSIKGKGLEGDFVYGWDGKDLILIPTASPDYTAIKAYSNIIQNNETIKAKDLVVGATYLDKNNIEWIYMGKFDHYRDAHRTLEDGVYKWYKKYTDIPFVEGRKSYNRFSNMVRMDYETLPMNYGKAFFFLCKHKHIDRFECFTSITKRLVSVVDSSCTSEYAELFEKLEHCDDYSPIDPSKEALTEYTFDEFREKLLAKDKDQELYWGVSFRDKEKYEFEIRKRNSQTMLTTSLREPDSSSYSSSSLREVEKIDVTGMSYKDLFDKIKPVHKDRHLANGKFYDRSY